MSSVTYIICLYVTSTLSLVDTIDASAARRYLIRIERDQQQQQQGHLEQHGNQDDFFQLDQYNRNQLRRQANDKDQAQLEKEMHSFYHRLVAEVDSLGTRVEVFNEEFNDSSGFTSFTPFFNSGNNVFTITDGTDIDNDLQYTGFADPTFFVAQDTVKATDTEIPFIIWENIDISGLTSIEFCGLFAEDDFFRNGVLEEAWESDDYIRIRYKIDADTEYTNLLWFHRDGVGVGPGQPREDTDFDGVGDGMALTPTATLFTKDILETGSTLTLKFEARLVAQEEDIAMDNFVISGVPSQN